MDKMTKGQMEAKISEAMIKFEMEYMGRGHMETKTYIIDDMFFVRLKGVLTQDEKSFFALDQDTGSAFVTPSRADVFFGIGDEAMYKAENLNAYGSLYYLLKK